MGMITSGLLFIAFLYATEPRTIAEVSTRGQVVLGTYDIDQQAFDEGLAAFRKDQFAAARSAFERADPERRDAVVQFYTAYSFYREGWGRLWNDDELFAAGVRSADRVIALDPAFRISDADLLMKTPHELKAEMLQGSQFSATDLDPTRLVRERK
jgi:hypothetical protein